MTTLRELNAAAEDVARMLMRQDRRIVFAESCTGGLVSAALTGIPGISAHHCGSAVVYRVETKSEWLGISRAVLERAGPVSREVASAMARLVLERTPEADLSAAVTGHLGPDAPDRQDGLIFIAVAHRNRGTDAGRPRISVQRHRLVQAPAGSRRSPRIERRRRQQAAAALVLEAVHQGLERDPRDGRKRPPRSKNP